MGCRRVGEEVNLRQPSPGGRIRPQTAFCIVTVSVQVLVGTASTECELSMFGCELERSVARWKDVVKEFLVLVAIWMIWNWVYELCFFKVPLIYCLLLCYLL